MGGGKGKKDNHAKWTTNFVKKYLNTKHTFCYNNNQM